jgi:hypothetical protein
MFPLVVGCTAGDSDKDDLANDGETDDTDDGAAALVDAYRCCATCFPEISFLPNQDCVFEEGIGTFHEVEVPGFGTVPCEQAGGSGPWVCTFQLLNPLTQGVTHQFGCAEIEAIVCDVQDAFDPELESVDGPNACAQFHVAHLDEFFGVQATFDAFDDAVDELCDENLHPGLNPGCSSNNATPINLAEHNLDECPPSRTTSQSGATIDYTLVIDDTDSWFRVFDGSTPLIDTPLVGALFAGTAPNRLLSGVALGDNTTFGGITWSNVSVGFVADIDLDLVNNTIDIDSSDIDGIWWSGVKSTTSTRQAWDVAPSQGASGTFNLGTGLWSLNYSQSTGIGTAYVQLKGSILTTSSP